MNVAATFKEGVAQYYKNRDDQRVVYEYLRGLTSYTGANGQATYQAEQCKDVVLTRMEQISQEDDFHRSILFFKRLKERHPISLTERRLPPAEEEAFIQEWRTKLLNPKQMATDLGRIKGVSENKSDSLEVKWTLYVWLGLPVTIIYNKRKLLITSSAFNDVYSEYNHGLEIALKSILIPKGLDTDGALLAFGCGKKANPRQGQIGRFVSDITMDPLRFKYSLEQGNYFSQGASLAEGFDTPLDLDATSVVITDDIHTESVITDSTGLSDILSSSKGLYILINTGNLPQKTYIVKSKYIRNLSILRDAAQQNTIIDIHPRLIYLLYKNPKTRALLGNETDEYNNRNARVQQILGHMSPIFNGKLVKSWMRPERPELAVFYWTLCWTVFNNTYIPNFYITPYNEQLAFIQKYIRETGSEKLGEEAANIMTTVDWATGRKESDSPIARFRTFMAELSRMTDSPIAKTSNTRRNYTVKRTRTVYAARQRAITLKDQCKGVNPAKLAATGEDDDYRRSLVFFKALKDREPISLASRGLDQEEEQEFVNDWIDSLMGITNQIAWSIYFFLGLSYKTSVSEVEDAYLQFINSGALAAFECKRKSGGSIRNITDFLNILLRDARQIHNTHLSKPEHTTSPDKKAGPPENNTTFRWGGAMPDFYKYYLPELTAAPTTCKLPASTKALEKIPALSLEQMFKRALLFWKRVQDGIPVPINERTLPAAEEEAFIRAWQGAITGAQNEEASSLEFLRATDATKAQYESEFNNVAMPLSAFDCKRRPDASLSFNRLVGYIQKTGAERQYAFEANVLGAEFGTLAAGAVGLTTVAFVSDRETPVQTVAGKTAVVAPASETLFVQVAGRQGKPYILPGDALLKAALPRVAFTQRAVVDLHPKVAYFLWRDLKLRNELLLPCFGEAFLPSFRAVHKSLKGYEDEFAAVYYQLCYEAAHWVPSGELAGSNAAYYGGRVPGAGVFPSPRGSIIENENVRITRSHATSPQSVITSVPAPVNSYASTPATFYRLPNREKYAKIILFLQAHPSYKLPALQWATPKQGFFSRLFTRKRKPLMNTWRNLQRSKSTYSQENIQSNSVMLDSLFGAMEDQPTPPHLQLNQRKLIGVRLLTKGNLNNINAARSGGTRKRRTRK